MKIDSLGKIYIGLMSVYFLISGFNALFDIDNKLERIGLMAINPDGKIAFILIYSGLMVGIGVAISLLYYFSKKWQYSVVLASTIIFSFIVFRVIGSFLAGGISDTQVSFLLIEMIEVSIGLGLLIKSGGLSVEQGANAITFSK